MIQKTREEYVEALMAAYETGYLHRDAFEDVEDAKAFFRRLVDTILNVKYGKEGPNK